MISYPSIGQFRNLIYTVKKTYKEQLPTLTFTGSVKVHGTNASVVIHSDGKQVPQSKKNELTPEKDNMGFAVFAHKNKHEFQYFYDQLINSKQITNEDTIVVYGEYAGGNIQKGVAVSELSKMFYVFGVKVVKTERNIWLKDYPIFCDGESIFDLRTIWNREIEIDFNNPKKVQNDLIEITTDVETLCPVGKHFGVNGIGEGVVWEHIDNDGSRFSFKVKGEKHSVTKVKKLASVDVEKLKSIEEFVNYAVTDNRLDQAFLEVCNNIPDRKLLGQFIKWVSTDVIKEELDTLASNDLTIKDVGGLLSKRARTWFFDKETL